AHVHRRLPLAPGEPHCGPPGDPAVGECPGSVKPRHARRAQQHPVEREERSAHAGAGADTTSEDHAPTLFDAREDVRIRLRIHFRVMASRASTTIRVRPTTRDRLLRIGKRRGLTTANLLDELATRAEEDDLVAGLN